MMTVQASIALALLAIYVAVGRYYRDGEAVRTLGRYYTRTLRIVDRHEIVASGVYRVLRHPGYLGVLLIFLGAALAVSSWVGLAFVGLVLPPILAYRAHAEEMMMAEHFGEAYRAYQRTARPLFPLIFRSGRKARPARPDGSSSDLALRRRA